MSETKRELSCAEQNAAAWLETIREHVACLDADRERLEELRDERASLVDAEKEARENYVAFGFVEAEAPPEDEEKAEELEEALKEAEEARREWDEENAEELAELEAAVKIDGEEVEEDSIRERIQESPLCVEVRSGWYTPGQLNKENAAEEYCILISTGGPALRIIGDLNGHNEPANAKLQHQDWGTPWTDMHGLTSEDDDVLLRWASCFYFGD